MTVISFPIPPYSNVPIQAQYYNPNSFFIENVTLGTSTTVTTTEDVNFVIGQLVRLVIPIQFGCRQLNEQTGFVTSIPAANQVIVSINSSQNVDPFESSSVPTQPQIVPVGDVNTGATNSQGRMNAGTFIPGSFINVSPSAG
jgi:ABC-type Fe3+-hydroxamate transport system substrate-binding protein